MRVLLLVLALGCLQRQNTLAEPTEVVEDVLDSTDTQSVYSVNQEPTGTATNQENEDPKSVAPTSGNEVGVVNNELTDKTDSLAAASEKEEAATGSQTTPSPAHKNSMPWTGGKKGWPNKKCNKTGDHNRAWGADHMANMTDEQKKELSTMRVSFQNLTNDVLSFLNASYHEMLNLPPKSDNASCHNRTVFVFKFISSLRLIAERHMHGAMGPHLMGWNGKPWHKMEGGSGPGGRKQHKGPGKGSDSEEEGGNGRGKGRRQHKGPGKGSDNGVDGRVGKTDFGGKGRGKNGTAKAQKGGQANEQISEGAAVLSGNMKLSLGLSGTVMSDLFAKIGKNKNTVNVSSGGSGSGGSRGGRKARPGGVYGPVAQG